MRAMDPFEKPVPLDKYQDYKDYVDEPMNLEKVDDKIERGIYKTPDDFEYDVLLIFENCEKYNSQKKHRSTDILNMSKHGLRAFKRIFTNYLKKYESGTFVPPAIPVAGGSKKAAETSRGVKRSATPTVPSKNLSSSTLSSAATKRLKTDAGAVKSLNLPSSSLTEKTASNEPDSLIVQIEKIKYMKINHHF